MMKIPSPYHVFEQGPIRPPSEVYSLCLRVTRNCPWNRCTFCPLYKDEKFSLRPVEDVKRDIDTVFRHTEILRSTLEDEGRLLSAAAVRNLRLQLNPEEQAAFIAALNWFLGGMESVFLQDANSLVIKPSKLVEILQHLRRRFPQIHRITSYARSHTIAKMKVEELRALKAAGLNRIHIGMESGSNQVLAMVEKGSTQAMHVTAGSKVKNAAIELSEYYMPGLGGQEYSREHALESAAALNQINPDFIRLRTLAIPTKVALFEDYRTGRFKKCTDLMVAEEMRLFLEHLDNITSTIQSDHIVNLLPDVEGRLPGDRNKMLQVLHDFLVADLERQRLYQVGRRCGFLSRLNMLDDPVAWTDMKAVCRQLGVTEDNFDAITDELMQRYI